MAANHQVIIFIDFKFYTQVNADDQLPELICPKCVLGIELSLSLRKQAVESNERLQNSIQKATQEDSSLKMEEEMQFTDENDEDFQGVSSDDTETDAVSFLLNKIKCSTRAGKSEIVEDIKVKRRFQCSVCDKRFLKRTNLTDHLKIHANVKAFRCGICEKSFIQYGNLKAHMRCHTKEKPFK